MTRFLATGCWLLAAGCAQLPSAGNAIMHDIVGMPFTAGNNVRLLQDGEATYRAMFAAMGAATDHINLESYIIEDDEICRHDGVWRATGGQIAREFRRQTGRAQASAVAGGRVSEA